MRFLQGRILEWVALPSFRGSSQPRDRNPCLPHFRQILHWLSYQGSPIILKWVAYPFSRGSPQPRKQTRVSCIAGGFFTSWANREAQYIYIKKYYSAIKKNAIMLFPTTWVDLETVILSEVSQTEKRHAIWHPLYVESKKKKKWYKGKYIKNRNSLTDIENKLIVTKWGSEGDNLAVWC